MRCMKKRSEPTSCRDLAGGAQRSDQAIGGFLRETESALSRESILDCEDNPAGIVRKCSWRKDDATNGM